jgi:hypothetical protein
VLLDPPVMQEMPDRYTPCGHGKVGNQPPVAPPPQALRAHHRGAVDVGLGEYLVHRGLESLGPHVGGIAAEHVLAPGGVG